MLTEVAGVTSAVVLGDEYVDDELPRRRSSALDKVDGLGSRRVGWIDGAPRWLVRECGDRLRLLAGHASRVGLDAYFSDLAFMEDAVRSAARPAALQA